MITALMIASALAAVAGLVNVRSGAGWARPLSFIGAIVALILSVVHMRSPPKGTVDWKGLFVQNYGTAGQVIGEAVAQKYPGASVAILLRPYGGQEKNLTEYEKARIKGIESGLGKGAKVRRVQLPWSEELQSRYPDEVAYQYMLDAGALRAAIGNLCPDAQVVVLASDFANVWEAPQALRSSFKLAAFDVGSATAETLVRTGLLEFAVTRTEGEVDFKNLPADPRAAFDRQYCLLSH